MSSTASKQLAKHFKDIHFGGNWTAVNLKDTMMDVSWQDANVKVTSFHTIAELVFHINYFVSVILKVLEGGPLEGNDKFSFDCPPIQSNQDWEQLLQKTWAEAERLTILIVQLPDAKLWEHFSEEKYGNYYRNLFGVIEHSHYHLGQIVILKRMISELENQ